MVATKMGLRSVICVVAIVTSVTVGIASSPSTSSTTTTAKSPSSTLSTTPHVPGLGDHCDGVCSPDETVVCVNHTCQCRPPLTNTTSKYCVTAPGPVVDFTITEVDDDRVSVTWEPPTTPGVIQEYHLYVMQGGQCIQGIVNGCKGSMGPGFYNRTTGCTPLSFYGYIDCQGDLAFNVTSLLSYTNYSFVMSANNDLYLGVNTTLRTQTNISAAQPPSNIIAKVQNSTSILVQWTTPTHDTGPTWYTVTVMEATGRQSSDFQPTETYRVDGFNSTLLQVTGLLPSWMYSFTVTAHTDAGDSDTVNTTNNFTTLPSVPGPIEDLNITDLDPPLMGLELTWNCPKERKRNGRITSYTVNYTGDVFITQMYGIYYPEDPCMGRKTLIIPIAPGVNYTFAISSNAEFKGEKATIAFDSEQNRSAFLLPANVIILEVQSISMTSTIAVGAVCGVVIVVLLVVFILKALHVHRTWRSRKFSVSYSSEKHGAL